MSSFSPTPAELSLVSQIFAQADPQKTGILTGDVAVRVFAGSKLSSQILGVIWNLADSDENGFLPRRGVAMAVRLIGWAQKGETPSKALINKPGPVATIEGLPAPLAQQNTGMSIPKSPPPGLPLLTAQDRAKFQKLFLGCGPTNGLLSGEKAHDFFIKSKLPVDKLGQIWNLADTQDRGSLDVTDFCVAMYFIQAAMSGKMAFIPTALPPGLYDQAAGKVQSQNTGTTGSFSPTNSLFTRSAIQPQYTGQTSLQQHVTRTPLHQTTTGPPLPSRTGSIPPFPTAQNQAWDITPVEKASADRFFDQLDSQKLGYIMGEVAVPFMLQSNLPEDDLAQVWDLADMNNDGRLTRDGFSVAMHLIQQKLAGKEIPVTLPPSLVPPSMRDTLSHRTAPAVVPQHPAPSESLRDLLWDETPPVSATAPQAPALQPQSTGMAVKSPLVFAQQASPPPALSSVFSQSTGQDPFGSSFAASSTSHQHKDLLGDDDEPAAVPSPLQDKSAEIGNLQNQLSSTNRSLETAKSERITLEQNLANQAAQLSALQTQLSSAKVAYETETKLLATLRERYSTQNSEMQKVREELIRAESDLSGIRVDKMEVESSFLRDKEEVRDLHRKMTETGTEIETLKIQIEKAKKEAKQQKGLLAIAKKQLATKEAERVKVESELVEANGEAQAVTKEREEAEAELAKAEVPAAAPVPQRVASPADSLVFAASQPLPTSPELLSPAIGTPKRNNPFERLASSTAPSRSQSPFLPFVETSLSSPPTTSGNMGHDNSTAALADNDPFGLSDLARPVESSLAENAKADNSGTAEQMLNGDIATSPISPSDHWGTPPDTAGPVQSPSQDIEQRLPSVEEAAAQASIIDSLGADQATDLYEPLKEVEADDSDSDESSDNEPLAKRRQSMVVKPTTPSTATDGAVGQSSVYPTTNETVSQHTTSFDDAFGDAMQTTTVSADSAKPLEEGVINDAPPTKPGPDAFGLPVAQDSSPFEPTVTDNLTTGVQVSQTTPVPTSEAGVAGVSVFDEALGKLPAGSSTQATSNFSFDTAFEDNFDFTTAFAENNLKPAEPATSATQVSFPPVPAPTKSSSLPLASPNGKSTSIQPPGLNNGFDNIFGVPSEQEQHTSTSPEPQKPLSFDDAFGTNISNNPSQGTQQSAATAATDAGLSFDEAFGAHDSTRFNIEQPFNSVSSKTSSAAEAQRRVPSSGSPPASPTNASSSSRGLFGRGASPTPRSMSPPPRVSSPRVRPSTGSSSKEATTDKLKEPAPRHSKLSSLRLPFGKKKSKQQIDSPAAHLPPASQFLSPIEEPRGVTPAVDDDIEAVKQLCGMGFSRTQAVTALENNDYNMQKALNSLLGTA